MSTNEVPTLLQYQQGNDVASAPDGFERITNPLNPLLRGASRTAHFTDGVYDLSAESHLSKLLKVLLGESGVGSVQRQILLVRLQQTLGGTHFFDLDAFYGTIFGTRRRSGELLSSNPYSQLLPHTEWDQLQLADGSYRARVERLSAAIHLGATPWGIEAVAEALTGIEFDLVESWMYGKYSQHTWDEWESGTWDDMEVYSWDELESSPTATSELPRNVITLYPQEELSPGEKFDLERAMDRIKPAQAIVLVSDDLPERNVTSIPFTPSSTSEKWEIRQLVQNTRINGILPYPDLPEDEFIEPPTAAFTGYSGEAWTVLDKDPKVLAYVTPTDTSLDERVDSNSIDMTPQSLLQRSGTTNVVALPEFAIRPIQGLYAGRSVSDGIVVFNPYAERVGDNTGLQIDKVPAEFVAESLTSASRVAQRFWTTPLRAKTDPANEILEIRFDEPVNINHISFEYAKYPCTIETQYWDRGDGLWHTLETTVERGSSPYGIGNTAPKDALHRFHYGSDHWQQVSLSFDPKSSRYFRLVLKRSPGLGPVGLNGKDITYPLGIRNIDLGYRVSSVNKTPHVPPLQPVATSSNIVGLQTRYFLERARAELVADALPTAWICEPQPIKDAVVNLYMSVGQSGQPKVVNELYTDPSHPGATMNVYYASSVPQGSAAAEPLDDPITPFATVGSVTVVPDRGLDFTSTDPAMLYIDGDSNGGDALSGDWWFGLEWEPITGSVAGNVLRPILASSMSGVPVFVGQAIALDEDNFTIFVQAKGVLARVMFPGYLPAPNDIVRVAIGIGQDGPIIHARAGGQTQVSTDWGFNAEAITSFPSDPYENDLEYDFAHTFNPNRESVPEGGVLKDYRDKAQLFFSATDYDGTSVLFNNESNVAQYIDVSADEHVTSVTPGILFPGVEGNFLKMDNDASFDVTGPQTHIVHVTLPDDVSGHQAIVSRWESGNEVFSLDIEAGEASIDINDGSITATTVTDGAVFTAGRKLWIAYCWHDDIDAGGTSYVGISISEDGDSWSPLDTDATLDDGGGVMTAADGRIQIGEREGATLQFTGILHAYKFIDDATPLVSADDANGYVVLPAEGTDIVDLTSDDIADVWDWYVNHFTPTTGPVIDVVDTHLDSPLRVVRDTFVGVDGWEIEGSSDMNITLQDPDSQTKTLQTLLDCHLLDNASVQAIRMVGAFSSGFTTDYATVPSGNFTATAMIQPNDLEQAVAVMLGQWDDGGPDNAWVLSTVAGVPTLLWSDDGSAVNTISSTVNLNTIFSDLDSFWLRVCVTEDDGGGNGEVRFQYSIDNITWTTLDTVAETGTITLHASSVALRAGSYEGGGGGQDGWMAYAGVAAGAADIEAATVSFEWDASLYDHTRYYSATAQNHWLDGTAVQSHMNNPNVQSADWKPIVTKKSAYGSTRGWGLYLANSTFRFQMSDGTNVVNQDIELDMQPDRIIGRKLTIEIDTNAAGDFIVSVGFRGETTVSETVLASTHPTGGITNSLNVQVLSDTAETTIGAVSLFAYDTTPNKSILAGGLDSLRDNVDFAAVGSSWRVIEAGRFRNFNLEVGDFLFPIQSDAMPIWGATAEDLDTMDFLYVPSGTLAMGSPTDVGSDIRLTRMAMGYGPVKVDFIDAPGPYSIIPISNVHSAYGTFIRYHLEYIGWADGGTPSMGFQGGPPNSWASAEWTPIGQTVLTKGVVSFPEVACVGLKMEFTDLAPEPYDSFIPINRVVDRFADIRPEERGRSYDQIAQSTIALLTPNRYPDSIRNLFFDEQVRSNYVPPTSGIAVIDGTQRDRLSTDLGFGYNYSAWQPSFRGAINPAVGVHEYNVTEVQHVSRTAFFVGLRTVDVRYARVDPVADTKIYDDTLLNSDNLDKPLTTMEVEPGQLYTPEAPSSAIMSFSRTATSVPFYSRRPVTALQFSTQQTGPTPVIPDDEFRNPNLVASDYTDVNGWHKSGDSIVFWDQNFGSVRVTRDPSVLEAFYGPDTPIVHPPVSPVLASGFGRTVTVDFDSYGGIASPQVAVSPKGVLYAGARVSGFGELNADLYLRIYGADDTTVLAERNFRPRDKVPTEVVLPYTLGNAPGLDDGISVRVEQDGPYRDSWIMHALSGFDTSILWEFSNDDGETWHPATQARGLRYGVLDFPYPGAALRWRVVCYRNNAIIDGIRMRPWYFKRMGSAL